MRAVANACSCEVFEGGAGVESEVVYAFEEYGAEEALWLLFGDLC